ncbi:MAG: chromosomal replication initiator protein DnaA [Patescibacteria group bacterium]|nr:chromosomal replication initiator protein DnaA [Patescibacteria group bacterium]
MKIENLWAAVRADLELSLSPGTFTTWVSPLEPISLNKKNKDKYLLLVGCPSVFHKNQISVRYVGKIQSIVEEKLKLKCEIELKVRSVESKKGPSSSRLRGASDLFSIDTDKVILEAYENSFYKAGLSPGLTFDNFAVSSSNEVAHAAAKTVAKKPGQVYRLIFIYGGVGVGKTHLMQAVGHEMLKKNPDRSIIYCTSEEFTNEIIEAIRNKSTPVFRQKYRKAGALFLDDVQFIGGKEKVQEEFFHTFNAVIKDGGQVILTSDRLPSEIIGLEDRLRSRFEGGLTVDVQKPGFELRAAILLIKAQQLGVDLPMKVAQVVAANVESTRMLEGILLRLNSEVITRKEPLTEELAMAMLNKINGESQNIKKVISPKKVLAGVANYFQLKVSDLKGKRRLRSIVLPRQVAMYLIRKEINFPLKETGRLLGGRDHTTILYGQDKISKMLTTSEKLRMDISTIRKNLYK